MSVPTRSVRLFREEALQEYLAPPRSAVLRLTRRWESISLLSLLGLTLLSAAFLLLVRVSEYAEGPAFVQAIGLTPITATAPGAVVDILVQPGQRVAARQELVRLNDAAESAEHDRARREFDMQLVRLLRDPRDEAARQTLTSLHSVRELARARMAERTLRAPRAGVVSDIRIQPGQHLAAGELVLNIAHDATRFAVVAALPGHHRPALKPGLRMRVELSGYAYGYLDVPITSVQDEVIGPAEVQRFLGRERGDTAAVSGPAVLANAVLDGRAFTFDGKEYRFFHGLKAQARVPVRSERAALALWPVLRRLVSP
jgi:multidrug efflux pump subunit AcrA (membrane-fusion protein)